MAPHKEPAEVVRSQLHEALTALHQAGYGDVSIDESIEVAEGALKKAWLAYTGETWQAPVRWLDDGEEEDEDEDEEEHAVSDDGDL